MIDGALREGARLENRITERIIEESMVPMTENGEA
jgi:hypothetical protein